MPCPAPKGKYARDREKFCTAFILFRTWKKSTLRGAVFTLGRPEAPFWKSLGRLPTAAPFFRTEAPFFKVTFCIASEAF